MKLTRAARPVAGLALQRRAFAALVFAVPVVVLYLVFQRYLVGGLTAGGVK